MVEVGATDELGACVVACFISMTGLDHGCGISSSMLSLSFCPCFFFFFVNCCALDEGDG